MEIDKLFEKNSIDSVADNVFGVVNNSVSEVREMQRKKVAENVQLIVNALKKIEEDIREKYDSVSSNLEKRIISIKDGRDGINGRDGKDGKDGKPGKDGRPGRDGKDGKNGLNGVDGQDGVSVVNAHIDFDGSLIISLSSGIEINVGEVIAPSLAEQIKVITNGGGTSQSVLDTLTSLQSQIDALSGATIYKGLWNASTNSPALTSGVGTSGNFYIVSVAGSTSLDGITNWGVGDWAIFNGSVWQRVEGGAAGNFTTVTASSLTSGRVTYAGAGGLLQDSSNLTFNGTTLTSTGFSGPLNGAIGGSTPAAGAFTTLSATENATITKAGSDTIASGPYFGLNSGGGTFAAFQLGASNTGDFWINGGSGWQRVMQMRQDYRLDVFSGLSVTGEVSATTGIKTADATTLYWGAGSSYILGSSASSAISIYTGSGVRGVFNNSGLSVTGTLSSTGNFTVNTDRVVFTHTAPANSLYLAASGNLGLGVSTPSTKLHLLDTGPVYIQMTDAGDGASRVGQNGTALTFGVDGADGSTERMRINSSGNVGIGTASPGARLHVEGGNLRLRATIDGSNGILQVFDTAGVANMSMYATSTTCWFGTVSSNDLGITTNNVERLRITAAGDVGIGTASPGAKFVVQSTGNTEARISTSNNTLGQTNTLRFSSTALSGAYSGGGAYIQSIQGSGVDVYSLAFGTADVSATATERMRISSSGNVGIGTASPIYRLDISGSSATIRAVGTSASNPSLILSSAGITAWSQTVSGSDSSLSWSRDSTERMRIDASGNVGIGTSSPTAKLDVSSDVIRLRTAKTPASASAAGNAGDIAWDSSYIYVCVATNTWKRVAIATW